MMGVFDLLTGDRILETSTQNGIPPQIKTMMWSPSQQFTQYISKDHGGLCDLLVTGMC